MSNSYLRKRWSPPRRIPSTRASERAALEQVGGLDEGQARVADDPPGDDRRDREEQLVDEPLGEHRAPGGGAALGEDQRMAEVVDGSQDRAAVEVLAGDDDLLGRQCGHRACALGCRQDFAAGRKDRVARGRRGRCA